MKRKFKHHMMINNSTNINKTNNHLSTQTQKRPPSMKLEIQKIHVIICRASFWTNMAPIINFIHTEISYTSTNHQRFLHHLLSFLEPTKLN